MDDATEAQRTAYERRKIIEEARRWAADAVEDARTLAKIADAEATNRLADVARVAEQATTDTSATVRVGSALNVQTYAQQAADMAVAADRADDEAERAAILDCQAKAAEGSVAVEQAAAKAVKAARRARDAVQGAEITVHAMLVALARESVVDALDALERAREAKRDAPKDIRVERAVVRAQDAYKTAKTYARLTGHRQERGDTEAAERAVLVAEDAAEAAAQEADRAEAAARDA